MNLGTVGDGLCLGGIFDLGLGSNIGTGGGNPSWVVGDTFLVRFCTLVVACGASADSWNLYRKTSTRYSGRTLFPWALRNCRTLQAAAQVRCLLFYLNYVLSLISRPFFCPVLVLNTICNTICTVDTTIDTDSICDTIN